MTPEIVPLPPEAVRRTRQERAQARRPAEEMHLDTAIVTAIHGDGTVDVDYYDDPMTGIPILGGGPHEIGQRTELLHQGTRWWSLGQPSVSPAPLEPAPWQPGDLKLVATAGTPDGWLECAGAAVSRTTYAALFAAIGTTYGPGNGTTTFNLPDLRGRVPMGVGNANGSNLALGGTVGAASVTLTTAQMPAHAHPVMGQVGSQTLDHGSQGRFAGWAGSGGGQFTDAAGAGSAGSGNAHENRQPSIGVRYLICTGA